MAFSKSNNDVAQYNVEGTYDKKEVYAPQVVSVPHDTSEIPEGMTSILHNDSLPSLPFFSPGPSITTNVKPGGKMSEEKIHAFGTYFEMRESEGMGERNSSTEQQRQSMEKFPMQNEKLYQIINVWGTINSHIEYAGQKISFTTQADHSKYKLLERLKKLKIETVINTLIFSIELKRKLTTDLESIYQKVRVIDSILNTIENDAHEQAIKQTLSLRLNELFDLISHLFNYIENHQENHQVFILDENKKKPRSIDKNTYFIKKNGGCLIIYYTDNSENIVENNLLIEEVNHYINDSLEKEKVGDIHLSYFTKHEGKIALENIQKFHAKTILIELEKWVQVIDAEFFLKTSMKVENKSSYGLLKIMQDINSQSSLQELLNVKLHELQVLFQEQNSYQRPNCFLCHAWSGEEESDSAIQDFLKLIKLNLELAGVVVHLDSMDPLEFFRQYTYGDCFILVGTTRSFNEKRKFTTFCQRLISIKESQYRVGVLTPRVSLLLLDNNEFKFIKNPEIYMEKRWNAISYIEYLKHLLRRIYRVSKDNVNYENLWLPFKNREEEQDPPLLNEDVSPIFSPVIPLKDKPEKNEDFAEDEPKKELLTMQTTKQLMETRLTLEQERENCSQIHKLIDHYSKSGEINFSSLYNLLNALLESKSIFLNQIKKLLDDESIRHTKNNKTLLHLAVEENNKETVIILLKLTNNLLNLQDDLGNTPLHYSAIHDLDEITCLLMAAGANVDIRNKETYSPIRTAAGEGSLKAIKNFLMKSKADFSFALYEAIACGKTDIMQEILTFASIDINETLKFSSRHSTYLCMACKQGYIDVVNILINVPNIDINKADVVDDKFKLKLSPLHLAIKHNRIQIVWCLLGLPGINIDAYAFYLAILYGNKELLDGLFLYESKINFNEAISTVQDSENQGDTVFAAACRRGDAEIVGLCLKKIKNININLVGKENLPPLFIACQQENVEIVEQLIRQKDIELIRTIPQQKIEVNLKNKPRKNSQKEPLRESVLNFCIEKNCNLKVLTILLKNPSLLTKADAEGYEPIHRAFIKGKQQLIEMLLAQKININLTATADEHSVAHLAMKNENYESVMLLLNKSPEFNVNLADKQGVTLLHLVCQSGKIDLLDKLLARKNLYLLPDGANNYPIYYLIKNNHLDMFVKLFNYKPDQKVVVNDEISSVILINYLVLLHKALNIHQWLLDNLILKISSTERRPFYSALLYCAIHYGDSIEIIEKLKNIISQDNELDETIKNRIYVDASYYAIDCKKPRVGLSLLDKENSEINYIPDGKNCSLIYYACNKLSAVLFEHLLDFSFIDVNVRHKSVSAVNYLMFKVISENIDQNIRLRFFDHLKLNFYNCRIQVNQKLTILGWAMDYQNLDLIKRLLKDPNAYEKFPGTELFYAGCMIEDKGLSDRFYTAVKLDTNFHDRNNMLIKAMRGNQVVFISGLLKYYNFGQVSAHDRGGLLSALKDSAEIVKQRFSIQLIQQLECAEIIKKGPLVIVEEYLKQDETQEDENLRRLKIAKDIIEGAGVSLQVSRNKKEVLEKFLYCISHDEVKLNSFMDIDFNAIKKCKNEDDICAVLKTQKSDFFSLFSSLILPDYGLTGFWAAGDSGSTSTFPILLKLQETLKSELLEGTLSPK